MKNLMLLSIVILTAFSSCGGSSTVNNNSDSRKASDQAAVAQNSNVAQDTAGDIGTAHPGASSVSSSKGASIIASLDCSGCHKDHEKLVGPAFADVAKKYTVADLDMLADKIIKGGAGHWGDIPMSAHASLSKADAEEIAKYVLSIK